MRMLVVLVLAALVSGPAEGRLVGKCELKRELEDAALELSERAKQRGFTDEEFVAKIVCHVEKATGFNTTAVSQLTSQMRAKRHVNDGASQLSLAKYTGKRNTAVWTLYGLFQLSDHLVCSSDTTASLDLCGMDCNQFIDDDIADDIECLETIKMKFESGLSGPHKAAFFRMIRVLFQEECHSVVASDYFSDCLTPSPV